MISSDWQLEQTGVDRAAALVRVARVVRRLTIWAGSWFELNGLRSKACGMLFLLKMHEIQELMSPLAFGGPSGGRG
jgi:hypothetical protein